jgi:hypothetical protein
VGTKAVRKLFVEIRRYLEAVDVFRAEGCEPRWSAAAVSWDASQPASL